MKTEMNSEKKAKLLLNMVREIGPIRSNRLLSHFSGAEAVFKGTAEEISSTCDIPPSLAKKIIETPNRIDIDREIDKIRQLEVNVTTIDDDNYPVQLKNINDPPIVLYYKGKLTDKNIPSIAIVGTRKPTSYGLAATDKLARELVAYEITLVSGLARGIDTCAHWSAIKNNGLTIAVLGNGLEYHYPPENRKLETEIAKTGALVSEFPVTAPPDKSNFPQRNRLIAALSLGTLVIEGDLSSGALITARFACEQGKDVFALPGTIFSKYSCGPHRLIKQGAKLVESTQDIIQEISLLAEWIINNKKSSRKIKSDELPLLNKTENNIIAFLEKEPQGIHIDILHEKTGLPFSDLSQYLLSLELRGLVKPLPGKIFIKIAL